MLSSDFNNHQKEKFKTLVKVDSASNCWIWQKSIVKTTGYGQWWANGKVVTTHRVSYAMFNGDIPDGLFVRHSNNCISRACCNPDHLSLGTNADNMQDVRDAGYDKVVTGKGEEHYHSKLTDIAVAEMRRSIREDYLSPKDFVDKFDVNVDVLCKAARGETWSHVPNPITEEELPNLQMKLRIGDIPYIRRRVEEGIPASFLAKEYGVTTATIIKVITGEQWGHIPGAMGEGFIRNLPQIILDRGWRICLKCDTIKTLDLFSKNKSSLNGYGSKCKACDNNSRK